MEEGSFGMAMMTMIKLIFNFIYEKIIKKFVILLFKIFLGRVYVKLKNLNVVLVINRKIYRRIFLFLNVVRVVFILGLILFIQISMFFVLVIFYNLFDGLFIYDCLVKFIYIILSVFINVDININEFFKNDLFYLSYFDYYIIFDLLQVIVVIVNLFVYSFFCFFYYLSFYLDYIIIENLNWLKIDINLNFINIIYKIDIIEDFYSRRFFSNYNDFSLVLKQEEVDNWRNIRHYKYGTNIEVFSLTFKKFFKRLIDFFQFSYSSYLNSNLKIFTYKRSIFPLPLKVMQYENIAHWNASDHKLAPTYKMGYLSLPRGEIFQQNRALLKAYITSTSNYLNHSWLRQGGYNSVPFFNTELYDQFLYPTGVPEGARVTLTSYFFLVKIILFAYMWDNFYDWYRTPSGDYAFDDKHELLNTNYDIQTDIESIYPLAQDNMNAEDKNENPKTIHRDEILKKFYSINDIEWLKQNFVGDFALEETNIIDNYPKFMDWIKFRVFSVLMPMYRLILLLLPSWIKNIVFFDNPSLVLKQVLIFFFNVPVLFLLILNFFFKFIKKFFDRFKSIFLFFLIMCIFFFLLWFFFY